ncbi:hypothetical protein [Micromonospora sp. NPDC049240]|uniref:hypothetical protein n=1 Tax=Micromonospora sp. NPDC049240 TaxID=3155151 RepID=UPI0033FAAD2D
MPPPRAELGREWAAELHELARSGRRWAMLRFAASPATSRAATSPVDRAVPRGRLWRTAGVLLLAPPAGLVALTRRGRTRTAWLVGVLGALVAADAPVARTVVAAIPATAPAVADLPPDAVDRVSAPLGCSPAGPTRRSDCPARRRGNGSSSPTGWWSSPCSPEPVAAPV